MQTKRKARVSTQGIIYHFEYTPASGESLARYRVRRTANGAWGNWSNWFETKSLGNTMKSLGFSIIAPTILNDFQFEYHFTRGQIALNPTIVKYLFDHMNDSPLNAKLLSGIKQIGGQWFISTGRINTDQLFLHLKAIILKFV